MGIGINHITSEMGVQMHIRKTNNITKQMVIEGLLKRSDLKDYEINMYIQENIDSGELCVGPNDEISLAKPPRKSIKLEDIINEYTSLFEDARKLVSLLDESILEPEIYMENECVHFLWLYGNQYPKIYIVLAKYLSYKNDYSYYCDLARGKYLGNRFDSMDNIPKELFDCLDTLFKKD